MNVTAGPNALQSATAMINRSQAGLRRDAAVVASPQGVTSPGTIAALIDSRQQLLYTSAGAKMIQASEDMLASLLDVHA